MLFDIYASKLAGNALREYLEAESAKEAILAYANSSSFLKGRDPYKSVDELRNDENSSHREIIAVPSTTLADLFPEDDEPAAPDPTFAEYFNHLVSRDEQAKVRDDCRKAALKGGSETAFKMWERAEKDVAHIEARMKELEQQTADLDAPNEPENHEVMQPQASRQRVQEQEIIKTLRDLGYDPKKLPKTRPGTPGPKSKAKEKIGAKMSDTVFKKAWERLRNFREIQDAT